jgi:glycosyltransferase involved in cell wall biosynthesis
MRFILYSEIDADSIGGSLGMPEYSYYFVLRGFRNALESLGDVIDVRDPAVEVDPLYRESCRAGEPCVFLSFSPPNKTLTTLACPTICVFAWEFSNIPDEVWDDDPRNDWRAAFAQLGRAITLSTHTVQVVKQAMGEHFSIAAVPVPVYAPALSAAAIPRSPLLAMRSLPVGCTVIDNRFYEITNDVFVARVPAECFDLHRWQGERVELAFKLGDKDSGLLGGFYEPEPWGTWSQFADPWVLLPFSLIGRCKLGIELIAYGPNVNTTIQVSIGEQSFALPLTDSFLCSEFIFDVRQPTNLVQFSGLDVSGIPEASDPRSMGIGVRRIWLESEDPASIAEFFSPAVEKKPFQLSLDGVVYTSVLNPGDGRKNWTDMLSAFCFAFRDEPRAMLILKMTHRSVGAFLGEFHYMLQRIGAVKCHVVILHGYLETNVYQQLIDVSTYYVNSSCCEGLCLPLMEFMSCGVPAVAPCHTAMEDYVDSDNTFIVDSGLEAGIWPHDSRGLFRTLRYRIDWQSLMNAYRESFQVACEDPERYRRMSSHAHDAQEGFCSQEIVKKKLSDFFNIESENRNAGTLSSSSSGC